MRGGFFNSEVDSRGGGSDHSDDFTLRFRHGANLGFTDRTRLKARLAATCSDSSCDPDVDISSRPGAGANIADGDIVIDEFYLEAQDERLRFANPLFREWWLRYGSVE